MTSHCAAYLENHAGRDDGSCTKLHQCSSITGQHHTQPVDGIRGIRGHDAVEGHLAHDQKDEEGALRRVNILDPALGYALTPVHINFWLKLTLDSGAATSGRRGVKGLMRSRKRTGGQLVNEITRTDEQCARPDIITDAQGGRFSALEDFSECQWERKRCRKSVVVSRGGCARTTTDSLTYCGKPAGELWKDTFRQAQCGDVSHWPADIPQADRDDQQAPSLYPCSMTVACRSRDAESYSSTGGRHTAAYYSAASLPTPNINVGDTSRHRRETLV